MSYTKIDTGVEHANYEELPVNQKLAVDAAFTAARLALSDYGIGQLANDDRAEELIAAIAYYIRRSQS
jgi:hypothetical protein